MNKCGSSLAEFVDNTPVVGHMKGCVHDILGDDERTELCMKGVFRLHSRFGSRIFDQNRDLGDSDSVAPVSRTKEISY